MVSDARALVLCLLLSSSAAMAQAERPPPTLSSLGGASLTANQTFLGTNRFSATLWGDAAAGANAFAISVNGARFDLGLGANDYIVSDGTNLSTPAQFTAAQLNGPLATSAASGSNGVAFSVNGARLDLGTGANDYLYSDGTKVLSPGQITSAGFNGTLATGTITIGVLGNRIYSDSATLRHGGNMADGASAVAVITGSDIAYANATAKLHSFRNNNVEKSAVDLNGKPIYPTGGAADIVGRKVLASGTGTVSTTAVTATSVIELTNCVVGGTVGIPMVGTVTAGTSFVINSITAGTTGTVNTADTSTICWKLIN